MSTGDRGQSSSSVEQGGGRKRRRHSPPISESLKRPSSISEVTATEASSSNAIADVKSDICTICLQVFREPYSTICGHTFCHACITASLEVQRKCPLCLIALPVDSSGPVLIPNFAVAHQVGNGSRSTKDTKDVSSFLTNIITADISAPSLDQLISMLCKKREEMVCGETRTTNALIDMFMDLMIKKKESELQSLEKQLDAMRADKTALAHITGATFDSIARTSPTFHALVPESTTSASVRKEAEPLRPEVLERLSDRVLKHYDGLQGLYTDISAQPPKCVIKEEVDSASDVSRPFSSRAPESNSPPLNVTTTDDRLGAFGKIIRGVSQYGSVERIASLNYDIETLPQQSIVSSLEFDKDGEMFVVAGVTKKIKIFDFDSVIKNPDSVHYPLGQLQCKSKISNISWNPYQKTILCSSDYDGNVNVWDTNTTQTVKTFHEHEKRCWTVHFNNVDPHLIASGSDDSKVKLWSLNCDRSVNTIDAKVNVCCVYFSPTSRHHLVFGSADHCVHLYDIRNTSKAVNVFKGHRKAVSYVRYINEDEVVSASTDSTLRVWCAKTGKCTRVLRGHSNEKNFVGLSGNGDHVMCGSENSRAYFYYKMLAEPMISCHVGKDINPGEEPDGFVSSVCWKKNSDIALAANSAGKVHVLKMS